jgi:hypothetical protein
LIAPTLPKEKMQKFGQQTPMKRAGQPSEVAPVFVALASGEAGHVTGSVCAVTGGMPML